MRAAITILLLCTFGCLRADTIHVGKNKPVTSLKEGIRIAREGDTIFLYKGVYREANLIIDKPICLVGVGQPVLDGEGKYEILTITGKNIVIRGLHLANAGYSSMNDYAALKVIDATDIMIEQNIISNAGFGIHMANSTHSVVRNNTIRGTSKSEHVSGNGVHLWKCSNMTVQGNTVQGHRDGIYFEFVTESTIQKNVSEKNIRYGLHFMFSHNDSYIGNIFRNNGAGVAVMYSRDVRMERNLFEKNWGASAYGILLKDISNSHISDNRFLQNTVGIHMEGSSRIEISRNVFQANGWAIKVQASCDDNHFRANNFYRNSFDVATNGMMMLNKFTNNYWDKYEGYDMNKDGVGDVPYHPVSMYSMIVEQNPNALMLLRSFAVSLLDKAERAIPSLVPESLMDDKPMLKPNRL